MLELLSTFSIAQIMIFIVLLAIAIKKVSDFIDWLQSKISKQNKKSQSEDEWKTKINTRLDSFDTTLDKIEGSVDKITDKVNVLMESDKDAIKAFITREHHYFCYQKGWIDDYTLDCLEKRYAHYVQEKGNSFIEQLMNEIRSLPKQDPNDGESK
jgi:esterase/lipase